MQGLFILNLFFVFLSGYWSREAFREGNKFGGWFNLVASAMNMAAVLSVVFK